MRKKLISIALLLGSPTFFFGNCVAQDVPAATPLTISTETLPEAVPQQYYWARLRANGGTPPLQWSVLRGEVPPGLELRDDGTISGVPNTAGEFRFTAGVNDSAQPPNQIHHQFTITVLTPLLLEWGPPPRLQDDQIQGGVKVKNGTKDTFDLTVIVVAVNEIGKAFALGYQRLEFKSGSADLEFPFGSTLPQGTYIVHADAVAELPSKYVIYRRHLQSPGPLQVTVGP